jgi:hypothetical protein
VFRLIFPLVNRGRRARLEQRIVLQLVQALRRPTSHDALHLLRPSNHDSDSFNRPSQSRIVSPRQPGRPMSSSSTSCSWRTWFIARVDSSRQAAKLVSPQACSCWSGSSVHCSLVAVHWLKPLETRERSKSVPRVGVFDQCHPSDFLSRCRKVPDRLHLHLAIFSAEPVPRRD